MTLLRVLAVLGGPKQLSTRGTTGGPKERVTRVVKVVAVLEVVGVADVVARTVATALLHLLAVAWEAKVERDRGKRGSTILLRPTGTILLRTWS